LVPTLCIAIKTRAQETLFYKAWFLLLPCPALSQKGLGVSAERHTLPTLLQGMVFAAALPSTIPKGDAAGQSIASSFMKTTGSFQILKEPGPTVL